MQRTTFLTGATALLAFATLMLAGCGAGSGGSDYKNSSCPGPPT